MWFCVWLQCGTCVLMAVSSSASHTITVRIIYLILVEVIYFNFFAHKLTEGFSA